MRLVKQTKIFSFSSDMAKPQAESFAQKSSKMVSPESLAEPVVQVGRQGNRFGYRAALRYWFLP